MNAATSTSVRSFPCIDDLRFKATKEADAAPVMMIIVHRTDSTETKYIYKTAAAGYNTKHRGTSKAMLPENATALVNYVLVRTLRNMVHYCSKTGLGPIKLTGFNSTSGMNLQFQTLEKIKMPQGDDGLAKPTASSYDEAMDALSSLITKRSRADKSNKGDRFDFLFDYVKMLDLEEPISKMSVIHVAGTKGKICERDQHAHLRNLFYVIAASTLVFSHLLTSLTSEKDFNWMVCTSAKRSFWHTSGGVGIGSRHAHLSPFL
ncbi:hypothetical protein RHMOL_Rhmol03G0155300 [Rhododendron molle]|uniref:Uncharacterized protein n=1 Tax=Rhododendron molle TaxID=49168 RepID=A0ACC0PH15_RHOML|nr:hypothetical protein RHMOL_Rhmol03G0155300 [Rhododendron molle]